MADKTFVDELIEEPLPSLSITSNKQQLSIEQFRKCFANKDDVVIPKLAVLQRFGDKKPPGLILQFDRKVPAPIAANNVIQLAKPIVAPPSSKRANSDQPQQSPSYSATSSAHEHSHSGDHRAETTSARDGIDAKAIANKFFHKGKLQQYHHTKPLLAKKDRQLHNATLAFNSLSYELLFTQQQLLFAQQQQQFNQPQFAPPHHFAEPYYQEPYYQEPRVHAGPSSRKRSRPGKRSKRSESLILVVNNGSPYCCVLVL
mmetsp:Transcript_21904/g.55755  ORF Transcript_21904/g.55755 Transcript_21904/m.55755 type:complete len:258 (+) Transcript_21904:927-1700(+)